MKPILLVAAFLAVTLVVAEPAAATCYSKQYTVDPVRGDTGTVVDEVKVTVGYMHCEPPPPA